MDHATSDIAIVGGGIAGCAAASFVRKALGEKATITVYERAAHVGGRLATIHLGGVDVEAGGTIIHETNRYMVGFVDDLRLERVEPLAGEPRGAPSAGIWNGERLVFRTHDSGLRTKLGALRRFGLTSPLRLQRAVRRAVDQWNAVYDHLERGHGFESPAAMLAELGLNGMLEQDGRQWLASKGVRGRFVDEYADGVGRIMYGQDVSMNGFATSIALAGAGLAGSLFSVGGGNRRVCEGLLREAQATLRVNSAVSGLAREGEGSEHVLQLARGASVRHDVVVLATPTGPTELSLSGVRLPEASLRPRAFQKTWATFVKGVVRSEFFGVGDSEELPDTVFTVESSAIPFSSLGLVAVAPAGRSVYKLFSREEPTETLLNTLFSERDATEQIRWEAYPVLRPCGELPPFKLATGLYWVNAMEYATSTMETEAVAERNVVNLLAADLTRR